MAINRFKRQQFRIDGAAEAASSQGANLSAEKVNTAVLQALSLWSAVTRISFVPAPASQPSADVPILFRHWGQPTGDLGNALIDINLDNDLFVDRFREKDLHPVRTGPFDLVRVVAHEVGHKLGLDHPPFLPGTTTESEPALMSRTQGEKAVLRTLFAYDIREIQKLFGTIVLDAPVKANFADSQLADTAPGVTFQTVPGAVVVGGPSGAACVVDLFVAAKGKAVNSIRLKATVVSKNVVLNRLEVWDGLVLVQAYYLCARSQSNDGLGGKTFEWHVGVLSRRKMKNLLRLRLEIFFTDVDGDHGVNGVVQITEATAEILAPLPIVVPTDPPVVVLGDADTP